MLKPQIYRLEVITNNITQDFFNLSFVKMIKIYKQVRPTATKVVRYILKNEKWEYDTTMMGKKSKAKYLIVGDEYVSKDGTHKIKFCGESVAIKGKLVFSSESWNESKLMTITDFKEGYVHE